MLMLPLMLPTLCTSHVANLPCARRVQQEEEESLSDTERRKASAPRSGAAAAVATAADVPGGEAAAGQVRACLHKCFTCSQCAAASRLPPCVPCMPQNRQSARLPVRAGCASALHLPALHLGGGPRCRGSGDAAGVPGRRSESLERGGMGGVQSQSHAGQPCEPSPACRPACAFARQFVNAAAAPSFLSCSPARW